MNERKSFQNGITLIALVISIIVMLILAGVSLNATIGDNGIITQAQNATYMQSIAALEEYFNNYYVEHYEEMSKKDESKVCIKVFNTGEKISEENLNKIWNRFYKADESRHREDGGTGIGLAFVKAIMGNYDNKYGVHNLENGVEFYFELDLKEKK